MLVTTATANTTGAVSLIATSQANSAIANQNNVQVTVAALTTESMVYCRSIWKAPSIAPTTARRRSGLTGRGRLDMFRPLRRRSAFVCPCSSVG